MCDTITFLEDLDRESAHRVGHQIKTLNHMFHRHVQSVIRKNNFEGMTMMHGWIISYLVHHDGVDVYQRDLERDFQIGKSSVASMLKLMEQKGYIIRESSKDDARLKKVIVTDAGRNHVRVMDEDRDRMEEMVTKNIAPEDLETFFKVIAQMKKNLK